MRKILRPQDILLLGLSGMADFLRELQDPLGIMSNAYKNMYGWVPNRFSRKDFYHLTWRTFKTGYIEKTIRKGEVYLRLTSKGKEKIMRDFPYLKLQKIKWDKKWRIVVFDIQEVSRNARNTLRSKLKELGFGMLQKSVFITPHDIIVDFMEFVEHLGLSDFVYAFEVSNVVARDIKELAEKVWHLDKLNEEYGKILRKMGENDLTTSNDRINKLNKVEKQKENGEEKEKIIEEIKAEYLEAALKDPFLPGELLPPDWQGTIVKNYVRRLRF